MTDAEVKNYIANVITEKFAAVTDGTGTAEINITTNNSGAGTSIGTFVDTTRTESIGTHPATGAVTTTTYTAKQVTAAAVESITNRPLAWDSRLEEMVDGDIDSTMDLCVEAMVAESTYTAGQYKLQATAPSGGTWVSRYTLTDTAQGGNTVTYLWQKTVASSAPTVDLTPLKLFAGSNCKQMTEAEIEQMLPVFRNRIIETGIGTYKIQSDAPSGGTWIQTGNTFTDTREEVTPQNYAGNYTGNFTGNFTGFYTGNFGGVLNYSGNYTGTYSGTTSFSAYTGSYSGAAAYSSNFSGATNYTGAYAGGGSGTPAGPSYSNPAGPSYSNPAGPSTPGINYTGFYAGTYQDLVPWNLYIGYYAGPGGTFTGFYGGVSFEGNYQGLITPNEPGEVYTGYYSSPSYTGNYAGTTNYTGYYLGPGVPGPSYTGNYAGNYAGAPIPGNPAGPSYANPAGPSYSTPGTFFAGTSYTGFYSGPGGTYTGFFTGPGGTYTGFYSIPGGTTPNYTGNYTGSYSSGGNYTGTYSGSYINTFSGTFSGNYSGATIQATKETVSSVKLWIRTA
jgi:voltage-gated sodium channel type IV alpha